MSLRRWGRRIKTLAEKGTPGTMAKHITQRRDATGRLYEFHATKGYRRPMEKKNA